ncbi:MAG: 2-hydroxychromene-2-carboxylate isomerase [Rhodovibrionaceae bacterium]
MAKRIEFFFDFSSPYGYLTAQQIEALGERQGVEVLWRPFLLGASFKETGIPPLVQVPWKSDYAKLDLPREARRIGVPYVWPEPFPFMSVSAARAFYWLDAQDSSQAKSLALALFHRAFGEGGDIAHAGQVVEVAVAEGLDRETVEAALQDPEIKDRLRKATDTAIERKVFGSPFVFVDDQAFWGHDRLPQVESWLETGGW